MVLAGSFCFVCLIATETGVMHWKRVPAMSEVYQSTSDSATKDSKNSLSIFDRHILIRASNLKMSHKHYLIELNMFLGDNAEAWPAQATIAEALNAGLSSVKQWQAELTRIGVVVVASGKGCRSSNTYRIDFSKLPSKERHSSAELPSPNSLPDRLLNEPNSLPHRPEWSATQTVNGLPHRPGMVCQLATKEHIKTQLKEQKKTHSPKSELFPRSESETGSQQDFENWYRIYPRKVAKEAARKAYESAIKKLAKTHGASSAAREYLAERTAAFAESDAGKRGTYTPHPGTWLNAARYDDDPIEWCVRDDRASRSADNAMLGAYEERERTPISEAVF